MGPKKKKPSAADNLIDSLLDEKTPGAVTDTAPGVRGESNPFQLIDAHEFKERDEKGPSNVAQSTLGHLSDPKIFDITGSLGVPELSLDDPNLAKSRDPIAAADQLARETIKKENKKPSAPPPPPPTASSKAKPSAPPPKPEVKKPNTKIDSEDVTVTLGRQLKASGSEDKTLLQPKGWSPSAAPATNDIDNSRADSSIDRFAPTEIRPGGLHAVKKDSGYEPQRPASAAPFSSTEAALKQSESFRVAQARLTELESEVERLRRENEKLVSAGETLRRRSDELAGKAETLETQSRETRESFEDEKKVLLSRVQGKEREAAELKARLEELEGRLESNFKKIRVRERELEHRLEIVKMESATLVSTKDKMILELKRQIDQLKHESDYAKQKSQELFSEFKKKQETIRRVARALRIALTSLEGDEDSGTPLKKAE